MRFKRFQTLLFLLILGCASPERDSSHKSQTESVSAQGQAQILSTWTEFAPGNEQIVRAVVSLPPCPSLETENGPVPMQERFHPDADFPVQVCEAHLPLSARKAVLNGVSLPLMTKASPEKILILGDTGCRIKPDEEGESTVVQACNDPKAWPFAEIASVGADWKPDLVVHVGDYHYREGKCPQGRRDCEGATPGDYWPSWNEDFMTPAAPLLKAAPWILVRGNHESCVRAGKGWFLLMDPGAFRDCDDRTDGFRLEFPDRVFEIIDSNFGDHLGPSLQKIPAADGKFRWVLSHRPFQTPGSIEDKYHVKVPPSLAAPGKMNLVLAGHWHFLNLNTFPSLKRAPEFIIGNGGTMLDEDKEPFRKHKEVKTVGFPDFGFVTMEKKKTGRWDLRVHGADGKIVRRCEFREDLKKVSELKCR